MDLAVNLKMLYFLLNVKMLSVLWSQWRRIEISTTKPGVSHFRSNFVFLSVNMTDLLAICFPKLRKKKCQMPKKNSKSLPLFVQFAWMGHLCTIITNGSMYLSGAAVVFGNFKKLIFIKCNLSQQKDMLTTRIHKTFLFQSVLYCLSIYVVCFLFGCTEKCLFVVCLSVDCSTICLFAYFCLIISLSILFFFSCRHTFFFTCELQIQQKNEETCW